MNNKFKVGDKVKSLINYRVGETATVIDIGNKLDEYRVRYADGFTNTRFGYALELLSPSNKIVIIPDGNKTIARLYDGNKVIKSAEAKCNPNDTYCFETGANLAYVRLMGTEIKIPSITEPKKDEPTYKVGDKVKVLNNNTFWHSVPNGMACTVKKTGIDPQYGAYIKVDYDGQRVSVADIEPIPTFDWDKFRKQKIAVHCDTEAKAKAFLRECEIALIRLTWRSGCKPTEHSPNLKYDNYMYVQNGVLVSDEIGGTKRLGYTIIECPFTSSEPVKTEPKYYSGRVVCIDKKDDCPFKLTVGKVYNVINGTMTIDDGYKTDYNPSLYVLGVALGAGFIPYRGIQI